MPDFILTSPDGQKYRVTGPEGATETDALAILQKQLGTQEAIPRGDWGALANRVNAAERNAREAGPIDPQTVEAVRQEEARRQGKLYGQAYAEKGAGLVSEGVHRAMDKFALGLPRLSEAYMPSWLGGQSSLPGADAHEFLKAADEGRAIKNPGTALVGNIGGIAGQTVAMPGSTAANLWARVGTSAAQSGILGAAENAIESRGDVGEVGKGAALGLIGGSGGQLVGEGVVKAGRALVDPLKGLAKSGPADQQAAARLALEAKRAGHLPGVNNDYPGVAAGLAKYGPDGFLGDALGPQGAAMARSAANWSPEARSILETASGGRIAGQTDRLIDAYNAASGTGGKTAMKIGENLDEASRPAINLAYNEARAAGYDLPRAPFEDLLASPKMQAAIKQAEAEVADRVAVYGGDQASKLAVYDAAKKILDKQGRDGDEVARGLARKLRDTVDDNVPEYGGARALAAEFKRALEGLEIGGNIANRNPGRDVEAIIKQAGAKNIPQERIAQGYGSARADMIANKGASDINLRISPAEESAMRAALGEKADDVLQAINRERDFSKFHKELTGNSSTARQLIQQMTGAGVLGGGIGWMTGIDPTTAGITGAALALGKRGAQKAVEAMHSKNEREVAEQLAKALVGRDMPAVVRQETARRALAEALIKDAGRGAGFAYGQ